MNEQRQPYWSFSGQVCFVDGFAWGIIEVGKEDIKQLKSVRLGTEEAINKILKDGGDPVPTYHQKPSQPCTAK